ncbi:MAG: FAD-dependent oxidoreductase [Lentisphaerae bacterium]|jgi:heterodisulfide reductase subunit A2|nr:FAD-dependent oxidoreductase [Lentisphaerota bacterium]MBT4814860.1 FAD-dependent oxidoreductase [Lentisphaerota bacterium]MBT5606289.1 FAD-dependent oxidoreductase [Lentisphaerota bacterium]MBT7059371.1 FAD-dependent oxidoreductase [Lentisphaerota bacterium]MBT7848266.1 FAD-dependent oxidoreductase [Lentisphaerota bacterium]
MPTITIDGKTIEAPAGATVLDVARDNDIWIPTLCHDKRLSDYGACRLCLVEATRRGRTKTTTSCTLPVQDGVEITTQSERLAKLRRLVMELILASCPNSPAVLEMAERLGALPGRLEAEAGSDCIRCGLCVRACAEISEAHAISFAHRGIDRTITTPFGDPTSDCVLCGACVSVCPTGSRLLDLASISGEAPSQLRSRFDAGLATRRVISRPFPQALPNVPAIDPAACLRLNNGSCGVCERVCEANAIRFDDQDTEEEIAVGAVIVASGYAEYEPYAKHETGYSRFPDVLTSMEFERMLSASGPFGGHVVRPSDGREPKRIAFLQCVGSRDISCRNGYCSSVCCMYAVKEAFIAKEHMDDVDTTVFFMDVRAFGKEFDRYCERAEKEREVRFKRARVHDVQRNGAGDMVVRYCEEGGGVSSDGFDLVVLSVGLAPNEATRRLAADLGVALNDFGFVWTDPDNPLHTARPGIFAAGAAAGPKDIPETVVQASAAACEASRLLAAGQGTLTEDRVFPAERDVSTDAPRVGVFVCHCGVNIGGVVDVPNVAELAERLPYVVYTEDEIYTCSQDSQEHLRDMIEEHRLNRVVIASCSPRTHEALFQETLREAGLNPSLVAMTNIRDQCSWAHMDQPEAATRKAHDLVRMAVAKAALGEPLTSERIPVTPKALVVGGGLAGIASALAIADRGYAVLLVEKEDTLGGNLLHIPVGFEDQDVVSFLEGHRRRLMAHELVTVRTQATLTDVTGFVGNFRSVLSDGSEYEHGVAIVATGAQEYEPTEFMYHESPRVVTQRELSARLAGMNGTWEDAPERVVMIQCVGSRNEEHPYCSRVCCNRAVKNALRIKELSPTTEVHVLYRDVRTYGLREVNYQQARGKGVHFVRFTEDAPPSVVAGDGDEVRVRFLEQTLQCELDLGTELVVLSSGIVADSDANDVVGKLFKVPINGDGFFLEAHAKLRPVEFATEGVFLAGLAHGPKSLDESLGQALAAASRACTILSKPDIEGQPNIAEVKPDSCVACGLCESLCAYNAISLELQQIGRDERVFAKVNPALCKGCGACVAGCRSGGLNLRGFTDQQILAEISQLF